MITRCAGGVTNVIDGVYGSGSFARWYQHCIRNVGTSSGGIDVPTIFLGSSIAQSTPRGW